VWSESRWGVWLHAVRPAHDLAELSRAAEELGATAVLVADEGTDRDLFVTLAAIAQRTQRVLLVGAVTNPHSRHPLATAAAFASLAELAPGRIVAGFGAGGTRVFGPMGLLPKRPFTALRECIDVVDGLLGGSVVDFAGEFTVRGASLPWTPGRLPIAIAGRGPRVEALSASRADWFLIAGRGVTSVAALATKVRAGGRAAIAWNPGVAWNEAMLGELREHFAYMTVDMPAADRAAVREESILAEYAVTGSRGEVERRLAQLRADVRPELFVFDAHDYSVGFLEELASVIAAAGIV
jgi:alkanesulfonate monooxygenase SsuD/methylene tetrahydromethanopterin reductase-like flavin-dependent oxidoreductase (luciferase family)